MHRKLSSAEHLPAYSSHHRNFSDPFPFETSEIARHPVTSGVKKVQFHALRPLMIFRSRNPEMKAFLPVPGDAEHKAGAPVIAGETFGKGRVAVSTCIIWCQLLHHGIAMRKQPLPSLPVRKNQ